MKKSSSSGDLVLVAVLVLSACAILSFVLVKKNRGPERTAEPVAVNELKIRALVPSASSLSKHEASSLSDVRVNHPVKSGAPELAKSPTQVNQASDIVAGTKVPSPQISQDKHEVVAEKRHAFFSKELNLTDDEIATLDRYEDSFNLKFRDLMFDSRGVNNVAELTALRTQRNQGLMAMLGDDRYGRYLEFQQKVVKYLTPKLSERPQL